MSLTYLEIAYNTLNIQLFKVIEAILYNLHDVNII